MKADSKRFLIYPLMLLMVISSFMLIILAYIIKYPFELEHLRALRDAPVATYQNSKMIIETDTNDFNARLFEELSRDGALPSGISLNGVACVFDGEPYNTGELYINVASTNFFGQIFSFYCTWELSLSDKVANVNIYDKRLGQYKIPYLGQFFWRLLKLPESVTIQTETENGLLYLSDFSVESDRVLLTYDYDNGKLAEVFNEILGMTDERKLEFHANNRSVDEHLLTIAREKSISPDDALELIVNFGKTPETFRSLSKLLSNQGIRTLYDYFGNSYYRHASAEMLIESSENELDSGLSVFNKRFARLLVQYLYRNPDYIVADGSIYSKDVKITPETILAGSDISPGSPYGVEIVADEHSIKALYSISGEVFERVILTD